MEVLTTVYSDMNNCSRYLQKMSEELDLSEEEDKSIDKSVVLPVTLNL